MKHLAILLGAALLVSPDAFGQNWNQVGSLPYPSPAPLQFYVSKSTGNDANPGTQASPWQNLQYAYGTGIDNALTAMSLPTTTPAVLIVEEGYYAPSNGETFPIVMKSRRYVVGENAHSTIVSLEGNSNIVFHFAGGDFEPDDGAYLDRLTIRNTGTAVGTEPPFAASDFWSVRDSMGMRHNPIPASGADQSAFHGLGIVVESSTPGECAQMPTAPTLANLVIYGFQIAIWDDNGAPQLLSSTVAGNWIGLGQFDQACCTDWTVRNCILVGNYTDMEGIAAQSVSFSSFETALPGFGLNCGLPPVAGVNGNQNFSLGAVAFVQPQPSPLPSASLIEAEFDLRLTALSAVRGQGVWTLPYTSSAPVYDAEGFANPRVDTWWGALNTASSDMGADQFNEFRLQTLARRLSGTPGTITGIGLHTSLNPAIVLTPRGVPSVPAVVTMAAVFIAPSPATLTSPVPIFGVEGLFALPVTSASVTMSPNPAVGLENPYSLAVPPATTIALQMLYVDPATGAFVLTNGQKFESL
ncbi:MAG: DUF1565 domain-containing protein [Planctomycetaceae bacterium]|nr:DUF1565 domain-containing protein [Planctomycetaceae bacterium]